MKTIYDPGEMASCFWKNALEDPIVKSVLKIDNPNNCQSMKRCIEHVFQNMQTFASGFDFNNEQEIAIFVLELCHRFSQIVESEDLYVFIPHFLDLFPGYKSHLIYELNSRIDTAKGMQAFLNSINSIPLT